MRSTSTILGVVVAVVASLSFVLFQSCGKKGGGGDSSETLDNSTAQTTTVADATLEATAVLADGSGLTVPAGVIPVGGTLSVVTVDAPAEIVLGELTGASPTLKFDATDAGGAPITELSQPGSLAIAITPAAALAAVDPVAANLCAVALALDGSKLVWRAAALTEVTAAHAKFLTKFLGQFRLLYCGDAKLDGFKEVGKDGALVPVVTEKPAAFIAGLAACNYETEACCALAVGKQSNLDPFKDPLCKSSGGVALKGGCPAANVKAYCVYKKGTTDERADVNYTGSKATKAQCETQGGEWLASYTPTPASKQEAPPEVQTTICGFALNSACSGEDGETCTMYIGDSYRDPQLSFLLSKESMCETPDVWLPEGCPSAPSPLACCKRTPSAGSEELVVMWADGGDRTTMAAAAIECTQALGGILYKLDGTTF